MSQNMAAYDNNNQGRVEFLLNQYITIRSEDLEKNEILMEYVSSTEHRPRTDSAASAESVLLQPLGGPVMAPQAVVADSAEENISGVVAIARQLRDISINFENSRALDNQTLNGNVPASEILASLTGQIPPVQVARLLVNRLTPDELEKALDYIRLNSEGHAQVALILDLMVALKVIIGARSAWPWVKESFLRYVLLHEDTCKELNQLSNENK